MSVRSLGALREDQAALLSEYRGRDRNGVASSGAEEIELVAAYAKVTTVVTSDGTYGAHLVVTPQEFAGTPPGAQDASKPTRRAYPTPNRVVADYTVGEFVLLHSARGALVGMKLG